MATPLCLLLQNVWIKDSTLHTLHSRLHPSHFTLHKLPTSIAFGFVDSISSFWIHLQFCLKSCFQSLPLLWLPLLLMLLLLLMMMTTMKMVMMLMLMLVLLSILLLLLLMLVTGKIQWHARKTHVVKINRYMLHLHLVHFSHAGKKNLKSGFWISLCCWRMLGLKWPCLLGHDGAPPGSAKHTFCWNSSWINYEDEDDKVVGKIQTSCSSYHWWQ